MRQTLATRAALVLRSKEDGSVNWISKFGGGDVETRFIYRRHNVHGNSNANNHISLYASSHPGCLMGCTMCHLTHKQERSFKPVTAAVYKEQVNLGLEHYRKQLETKTMAPAKWLYINFMARGECLLNPTLVNDTHSLVDHWRKQCEDHNLQLRLNLSTILPREYPKHKLMGLADLNLPVHMYYSMYSLHPTFRSKWLPNAMEPERALDMLKEWETTSNRPVTFHWPLIKGENDTPERVEAIVDAIKKRNFEGRYHLVRYNPPSSASEESDPATRARVFHALAHAFPDPTKSKCIPRIAKEVFGSCGTFWSQSG